MVKKYCLEISEEDMKTLITSKIFEDENGLENYKYHNIAKFVLNNIPKIIKKNPNLKKFFDKEYKEFKELGFI